jgi:hypothetical protein
MGRSADPSTNTSPYNDGHQENFGPEHVPYREEEIIVARVDDDVRTYSKRWMRVLRHRRN